jgi:hypothetical protein
MLMNHRDVSAKGENSLMNARHCIELVAYVAFVLALSFACFRRPVTDDFDRYIYEALVRGKYETVETVYPIVKHSNKRAEESTILDSAIHLGQLEPMYAVKPLYVRAIEATEFTGLPMQSRINLISALSLFGVGLVVLAWTGKPGYSVLLLASSAITVIFRMGTPDGLSAFIVLAGLWAISQSRYLIGIIFLIISVWIRTDNVLLVMAILVYLLWRRNINAADASVLGMISVGSVALINHLSGNYSWRVLFQFSFIGGRSPAEIDPRFGISEFVGVAIRNAETIVPQIAIWAFLGAIAWKVIPSRSTLLIPVWGAVVAHYMLYPSPESRYLVWAFLVTGIILVAALQRQNLPDNLNDL